MTRLSVNINKIALLRNARGGNNPDIIKVALDCERFGAQGITVHPRPDERHITYQDVYDLKKIVTTELNVEGNPTPDFLKMVMDVQPDQVTLVPDAPDALTSDSGWDTITHQDYLKDIIRSLKEKGIRASIFLNPSEEMLDAAVTTGTDRIELYTEPYADQYTNNPEKAVAAYRHIAALALQKGLDVNAGHDLNLENLSFFKQELPGLAEVSIGHALVCDALYYGLENVIQMYLHRLK